MDQTIQCDFRNPRDCTAVTELGSAGVWGSLWARHSPDHRRRNRNRNRTSLGPADLVMATNRRGKGSCHPPNDGEQTCNPSSAVCVWCCPLSDCELFGGMTPFSSLSRSRDRCQHHMAKPFRKQTTHEIHIDHTRCPGSSHETQSLPLLRSIYHDVEWYGICLGAP